MGSVRGMRTGGRNRKSATHHVLVGTFKPSRHASQTAVAEAPAGVPGPPEGLPEDVLAHWRRTVECLQAMGTVSTVDGLVVEQYARLFAETAKLAVTQTETAASIARLEENLRDLKGAELVQCFQEITKLRQLEARYATQIRQGRMAQRQYLIELCLTPAARSRGVSRSTPAGAPAVDPKKQRYLDGLTKSSA